MIYTSYEMVADCRAGKSEGWLYFVSNYVPVIRKLLAHYGETSALERLLTGLHNPESSLFRNLEPLPERSFIAVLRQRVLAETPRPQPEFPLDLETLSAAFEHLTLVERQVAWIESMGYSAAETGAMMRMAPHTVEKIRERAAQLLRDKLDHWSANILGSNGRVLGQAAAAAETKDCPVSKVFLDILDGRTTWLGRETMEQHVLGCWHCIDHFSRMVEVVELIRGVQPLSDLETEPFRVLLGVEKTKPGLWKRLVLRH